VTKISPSGSTVLYSSYLGDATKDSGVGIALDGSGNAYVIRQRTTVVATRYCCLKGILGCHGYCYRYTARTHTAVDKIDASGSVVAYSTTLSGSGSDSGTAVVVGPSGIAYVTGATTSTNLSTPGSLQPVNAGGGDAFLAELDPNGAVAYFTYLGGKSSDSGNGIALDSSGNAYLVGTTASLEPLSIGDPVQAANAGGTDAFVAKFNAGGFLVFFSYLGGSSADMGKGIAVDGSGSAYVVGTTSSTDFPTRDPFQAVNAGGNGDAFVAKLSTPAPPPPAATSSFFTIAPCRAIDTRKADAPLGGPALNAGSIRGFTLSGQCSIPATARALSVNIAVTETDAAGDLRLFPVGIAVPSASTITYSANQTRANNAIVQLGTDGDLQVFVDQPAGTVQFILDVNGYFQ